MDVVEASCLVKRNEGEDTYTLYPKTKLDKSTIESLVDDRGRYVTLRLTSKEKSKSYEMTKAFWALLSLYYSCLMGSDPETGKRKSPTSKELRWFYEELLPDLFPVRESVLDNGKFAPKHWSEVTKIEGMGIINKLIVLISQCEGITDIEAVTCRDIFEWVLGERSEFDFDPIDYDENGDPYSLEEWAERNKVCMVTGIVGGDVCHIVSRGEARGFEWLINQSWNLYRCNHVVHIDVQHGKPGWNGLFNGFDIDLGQGKKHYAAPWLKGRCDRARRIFHTARQMSLAGVSREDVLDSLNYYNMTGG